MVQNKNVFEKNPVPGSDILIRLLNRKLSVKGAIQEFKDHNVSVSDRTIQRHVKRIRENSKPKTKTIQNVISEPKTEIIQFPPKLEKNEIVDVFKKQYEEKDYSDIPDIDPIKLLDKQLHDLEMLLILYPTDIVVQKTLIELEMKIAEKLFKMRPTQTEFNINELLRKNDISVAFIMQLDQKHPNLDIKISWLDFTKIHQNL